MLKNLSLHVKLTITVLLIGLIVGGVNFMQIVAVERANKLSDELVNVDLQRLSILQDISSDNDELTQNPENYQITIGSANPQLQNSLKTIITARVAKLQKSVDSYKALTIGDDNPPDQQKLDTFYTSADALIKDAKAALGSPTGTISSSIQESNKKFNAALADLMQYEQTAISQEKVEVMAAIKQIKSMLLLMTLGVTLAAIFISVVLARSIGASLVKLRKSAQRIANGDFSVPAVVSGNDEIGQLGKSFNDMSERLRDSYRRLAIEQQRDEAILQSMGEGLIATDETGKILLMNHVAARYLSVADDTSVVGKHIQEVYDLYDVNDKSEKPLPHDQRPVFMALSTASMVHDVFAFHSTDGKKALLDVTATPIMFSDKVVGAISVLRDVTKEKEVDRMKTEFISLASHQLRTPLSAIKWFTEMLVSGDAGKLSPEQMEFAKNIDDSTERMIALVNALLNISRIESGRIIIDPQPTDLQELVTGIVNDLKAKTEERQQTLLISVHQDLPKINLDPRLIGQVYLNLLTNAVKYTQKGGEISVFISRKDDQIISQITDNGYGIPKEQQDRVFQKFFRAANAVKVETDGTGLGLYLIKAVVESSGGKIWFESEEGKGTTFWFSIPLTGMKPKEGEVTLDV
jgi:two-component system, OmpR family, sensor histidine kinase VicK